MPVRWKRGQVIVTGYGECAFVLDGQAAGAATVTTVTDVAEAALARHGAAWHTSWATRIYITNS